MRNGSTAQVNPNKILLCILNALTDCIRNFAGLTQTETDNRVYGAYNSECLELHDTAALNVLAEKVNGDNALHQLHVCCINQCQSKSLLYQNWSPFSRAPSASS